MVKLASLVLESSGNYGDEIWRGEHSDQNNQGGYQCQQTENRTGDMPRFLVVILSQKLCVNRNERRGEGPFAKDVLKEIGNAEGGGESVPGPGYAEVVCEDALPDQANDATYENTSANE